MEQEGIRKMTERERVIKALDTHLLPPTGCDDCLYVDAGRNCYRLLLTDALKLLKEQPEIVRCKDCKWFSEKGFCKHPDGGAGNIRPADWFCGDGKRRETND